MRKGSHACLEGKLVVNKYDNPKTNKTEYQTKLLVNNVIFLDKKEDFEKKTENTEYEKFSIDEVNVNNFDDIISDENWD